MKTQEVRTQLVKHLLEVLTQHETIVSDDIHSASEIFVISDVSVRKYAIYPLLQLKIIKQIPNEYGYSYGDNFFYYADGKVDFDAFIEFSTAFENTKCKKGTDFAKRLFSGDLLKSHLDKIFPVVNNAPFPEVNSKTVVSARISTGLSEMIRAFCNETDTTISDVIETILLRASYTGFTYKEESDLKQYSQVDVKAQKSFERLLDLNKVEKYDAYTGELLSAEDRISFLALRHELKWE